MQDAVTYTFEGFELTPARRLLQRDGKALQVHARAFDLLVALVERAGQVVGKNELLDLVWRNVVVEEGNLPVQVSGLRKLLGGDIIRTVPGRGYCFTARLQTRGDAAVPPTPAPPAGSSAARPAAPRLYGRDTDLAGLDSLLKAAGFVTLVGPSGVGKTSLARAAAARWNGRTAWVDLAALSHGNQVPGAIARAFGVHLGDGDAIAQLLRAIKGESVLLLLDNAEHLIEACAQAAVALRTLPDVQVLVTSQVPLAVEGERVQRLEPLALSDLGAPAAGNLGDGAMALLEERVVAADHRFRVTPDSLPLLQSICTHLDGLPLALEMAAARVPAIGLQGVHDALEHRFALLTRTRRDAADRHRTLHNALDWSYRLLAAPEQRLFRLLGVFAGGFTLELAVAVAAENDDARWDVIDRLAALVDRSLVSVGAGDPPRYRLLETMRAFALQQLAATGEEASARARHAGAMLALFSGGPADARKQAQREVEMENARDAIGWASAHDLRLAALLTARVVEASPFTAWRTEAGNWLLALEPLMHQPAGTALPPEVRADWWTALARTLVFRNQKRASSEARRALELWRPLNRPRGSLAAAIAWVRSALGPGPELDAACAELQALAAALPDLTATERLLVHGALVKAALERNDYAAVLEGRLKEVALARELGFEGAADAAESNVVFALINTERHAEAVERGKALLARIDARAGNADANLPWVLYGIVEGLVKAGRHGETVPLLPRLVEANRRFGEITVLAPLLCAVVAQRRYRSAARLLGHALQVHEARGVDPGIDGGGLLHETKVATIAALGAAQAEALIEQGRMLGDEAAAALALGTGD